MEHKCQVEQLFLDIYDETGEPMDVDNGVGSVICKIRCTRCEEIYLERVPYSTFTEDDLEGDL